jgi:hypothetical protein
VLVRTGQLCAKSGLMHRDRRRVRKIDLRRYELAPRPNDFAHAVGLSNGHKRVTLQRAILRTY